MKRARKKLIDKIFSEALELDGGEREAFVDKRCAGDADLQRQVLGLLRVSATSDDAYAKRFDTIRDNLWQSIVAEDEISAEDLSGQRIGAWLLEERIARGGLATVYKARRDDGAYEQSAAFKVLRRGLDTDDVISRFRAERQILSTLDHPSITQILDGGALDDGRPYLVLEFVDGLHITDYCEKNELDIHERVRLLIDVLDALHHAHSHLVVHRDIKPSNILVSTDGNIALLDFGIAKLLDPGSMPGASTLTRTGVSLLTPGYGSPEQHAGAAITTASDIYQAGLVLYELLTGERCFKSRPDTGAFEPAVPSQVLRGRPSYKVVKGDLDAITRKATHGDPAQRYASANKMAEDLERYLQGHPVSAQPDSVRYRFAKLRRRRPWLMPVIALGALGIAAYVATLTLYNRQLQIEQHRATAAQDFLVEILRSPDPFVPAVSTRGRDITVVEALNLGVQRLRTEHDDDPRLRSALLTSISSVHSSLDEHRRAIDLREESLTLEKEIHGDESENVIVSLRFLAGEYQTTGDFPHAGRLFGEQLAIAEKLYHADSPELGVAEAAAGEFHSNNGNPDAGTLLMMAGIEKMRLAPRQYAPALINSIVTVVALRNYEPVEETQAMLVEAQALADSVFGHDSMLSAIVQTETATTLSSIREYETAEEAFLSAIEIYESRVGRDHGATIAALNNLAILYGRKPDPVRAEHVHRELLEHYLTKYGARHQGTAKSYQNLATMLTRQGRYEESIPLHRKARESYLAVLPEEHRDTAIPLLSIAYAQLLQRKAPAAELSATEALQHFQNTAPESLFEGVALCLLGLSLEAQGNTDEANALIERSHALLGKGAVLEPYLSFCRVPAP